MQLNFAAFKFNGFAVRKSKLRIKIPRKMTLKFDREIKKIVFVRKQKNSVKMQRKIYFFGKKLDEIHIVAPNREIKIPQNS